MGQHPTEYPRGASSFISRHSKRCNSKAETPISSSAMSDFNDIDQMLGERVMKAAMKQRNEEAQGNPAFKRSGTYHAVSRKVSFGPGNSNRSLVPDVPAPSAPSPSGSKLLKLEDVPKPISTKRGAPCPAPVITAEAIPQEVPKSPKVSTREQVSLSHVFQDRETQLIPVSPTGTTGTSMRLPTASSDHGSPQLGEEDDEGSHCRTSPSESLTQHHLTVYRIIMLALHPAV